MRTDVFIHYGRDSAGLREFVRFLRANRIDHDDHDSWVSVPRPSPAAHSKAKSLGLRAESTDKGMAYE